MNTANTTQYIAGKVASHLLTNGHTINDLADTLEITNNEATKYITGSHPFTTDHLFVIGMWLKLDTNAFTPDPDERWLTLKEAARALRLNTEVLRRKLVEGDIEGHQAGANCNWLVSSYVVKELRTCKA